MSSLEVRSIADSELDLWNIFDDKSLQGTLFHKSYWLRASGEGFKIYGCFKGEELLAGMPIVCSVSRLGVKGAHRPPLTPYFGVIFRNNKAKYVTRISDEKGMGKAIAARLKELTSSSRYVM